MRTPLTALGTWVQRPLISLFMLLVMLALANQAMAAAPVITSPATGTTLPSVAVGQSMSIPISSTGGATPLDKWVQCDANDPDYDGVTPCLPAGLILDPSPGSSTTLLHGAPTTAGTYTFSITLNDAMNQGGVATYTLVVTSSAAPTLTSAAPNTGTTAGATSVTLTGTNLTGATAVSFGGTAATGYTVNNATTITATTPAHAAGAVNVVVTTPGGTVTLSNGYTYTVPAPVAGPVSATVAANSSANPITLALSGGAATSVAVASAASHGTATASGTSITYTPTAGFSGSDSFTYTATNASGTSSPATVTITVSAPTLVLTPATLGAGTAGSAYSATLSVAGGTAPYTYAISAGSLPAGLSLNVASGLISGTPSTAGTSNLTVTATDANGATGVRNYSIAISAVAITVPASSQILAAGQSATVDLTQGATGGPFTQAILGSVTPASAGRARMIGPFSMSFVPSAAFAGTAVVSFSLQNGGGASAASTVSFIIQERPDPTQDAEVIGLLNAQTRAAERFASTQMDNFNRRLEQLHQMNCDRNSFNASLRNEGRDVPLGEIAKAVQDQLGASAHQTEQEKREAAAALKDSCKQDALAFWSDGFVNVGSTHTRGARDSSFTTLGLSVGVDYRLSPSAIAGVGIGYGNDRSDIGKNNTRSDGDAIGIATYLSLNLAPQVYVDGLLGYNRISFDSRRYITGSADDYARGSRDADQLFASLTASYEYRQGPLSLTPYSRLNASTTRMDAYRERGGGIYGLSYDEQRQQNFTSYLGVRTGYDLMTRIGVVTPKVGLAWGHNFSSSSDYKMRYTDQGDEGTLYRLKPDALDSDFASLDMGVDFNLGRAWQLGVSYKTALGSDERNDTFRLGLNGKF
ncbi:autotransporter domain-containing protein [Pseudomonas saponiphila]|uniref:autotransporter domain-containing protein n=1 Tax=Pseudomonas saponiphila TaxID=556534 RepID=UPI00223EC94E|nr:autotransporter domain-containing protein [Pseudomonas saponiphila]